MRAFSKDIRRTIKSSLGRFLAILLIVGLGSGFYAALRMTAPDMKYSADEYYDNTNLEDVRIVSTLGVTEDDLVAVKEVEGIENACLAYETDIIGNLNDVQIPMRVHSYLGNNGINDLVLTSGRFPETAGECVISEDCVIGVDKNIGDVIHMDEGTNDLDDVFTTRDLKIVGKVRSSYYVAFASPGTTTLGSGQIDEFLYVGGGTFKDSYPYTEIFATVKGAKEEFASSDAYKSVVQKCIDNINCIAPERESARIDEVRSEAQSKLDDNKAEYEKSKIEADAQIADAERQIADNEIKLRDSKTTLDNAYDTINAKVDELNSAPKNIDDAQSQLNIAKENRDKVAESLAIAKESVEQLPPEHPNYADAYARYMELSVTYDSLNSVISEGEAELEASRQQYSAGKVAIEQSKTEYYKGIDEYNKGCEELAKAKEELANKKDEVADQLADAKKKIDDAQAEIDALEYPSWLVMDRTKNQGVESYISDADRVDGIAQVFPLIFFLVAALVALTTMTRMVDEERANIGTYKALGYSRNIIASKYLIYAGVASSIGAILGISILGVALPNIIMYAYSIMYYMPNDLFMPFDWGIVAISFIAGVGITLLATWAAVVSSVHETPASLMRPKVDKAGTRILFERIMPIWKHLSFSRKVTMRNIFRYKKRFFMTVVGIAGCTGLLLTGFGLSDAINDIIDKQYGNTVQYNSIVGIDEEATDVERSALDDVLSKSDNVEFSVKCLQEPVISTTDDGPEMTTTLIVPAQPDEFSKAWKLRERKSQDGIGIDNSGVIVNEKLATKLGKRVGDMIQVCVQDDMGNATNQRFDYKISAIFENYVSNYVIMTSDLYSNLYPNTTIVYDTDLVKIDGDHDSRTSFESVTRQTGAVKTISDNEDVIATYRNALNSVNMIVVILVVCAGLLAFVVLCNLININITERKREIATLMVLGFNRREVETYVYREIVILTIIGVIFGIIFGFFLEGFVVTSAEVDYVMFGREIHIFSYVISSIITLLFAGLVMFFMRKKFDQVDMVESLKSNE